MIDSVNVETRSAPEIEIGTVYGPLATRISLGGLSVIRAGAVDGAAAVPGTEFAGAGAGGATGGGGGATGAGASGGGENTCTLLGSVTGGAAGGITLPGIGEAVGGGTGRWVLPVGSTGAAAGCVASDGDPTAGVGAEMPAGKAGAPAVTCDNGTDPAAPAAAGGSGSLLDPIVAGGPVNDMLLCVPM